MSMQSVCLAEFHQLLFTSNNITVINHFDIKLVLIQLDSWNLLLPSCLLTIPS